jgi:peptide/nickel transport system permease protein
MTSLIATDPTDATTAADATPAGRVRGPRWGRRVIVGTSVTILAVVAVFALVPGLVATHGPTVTDLSAVGQGPSAAHWFGTDQLGRDIFSRVVYGARLSLLIGVVSTVIGASIGGLLGLLAGYAGGAVDAFLMRFVDVMLAIPGIMLALVIIAVRGPGTVNLVIAIGVGAIPEYARLMRGQVRSIRQRPFMEAAVAAGSRAHVLIFRHLLPNAISPLLVLATIGIGVSILVASGLSFLGLGPRPPEAEWGSMLADARDYAADFWWMTTFPGLAIVATVVAVNIVGQHLRGRVERREDSR